MNITVTLEDLIKELEKYNQRHYVKPENSDLNSIADAIQTTSIKFFSDGSGVLKNKTDKVLAVGSLDDIYNWLVEDNRSDS